MSKQLVAAMIVKNEATVLQRCFDSLAPHVSSITINDNGSTDRTPIIIDLFEGTSVIPVEGAWVDFAHNRNLVLEQARKAGEYVLCHIDADEELVVPEGYVWPVLTADAYCIPVHLGNLVYPRPAIVRSDYPWKWRYPVQEGLYPVVGASHAPVIDDLKGPYILSHRGEGARSKDPETQVKDLKLLQDYLALHPDDPRMTFYLAQQLKDMGRWSHADMAYEARLQLGGYKDELWYSRFMVGRISEFRQQYPVDDYIDAFNMDPTRAEPLYYAADWCRRNERLPEAFIYASAGALLQTPEDGFFIETDVYEWKLLDIIASVAWYTPYKNFGADAAQVLMTRRFPAEHAQRILTNYRFYVQLNAHVDEPRPLDVPEIPTES